MQAKTLPATRPGDAAPPSPDALCRAVTAAILGDLRRGVRPWHRPWGPGPLAAHALVPLRHDGTPYQGLNVLLLWMAARAHGAGSPHWLTTRRAALLGGTVRPGAASATVLYAGRLRVPNPPPGRGPDGGEEGDGVPFAKAYRVFNAADVDGLPARLIPAPPPRHAVPLPVARAERFFRAVGARVLHGGGAACYCPGPDHIRMPPMGCFRDAPAYYATLAHEHVHWTRHPSRLGRDLGRKRWGDAGYALEELVAELGAAFLCARLGLAPEPMPGHARYVGSWLAALGHDHTAVLDMAGHAQRAVDHLYGLAAAGQA